ncbi:hypothetical protein HYPSUDRAFT_201641 [Hypholoma sublateritium FD-334 SS-4]|uniref:Cytochrome P450 n=1 Tax=Hypholoma sublateritium (strain FD-334 SS-4) TaxID=945553 RepID=A0A0D2MHF9_HYPSF|nr:hypothetical protein HYPSUDRAFT_201641 [Hypholoma sublateritium FD-334 SS-4]
MSTSKYTTIPTESLLLYWQQAPSYIFLAAVTALGLLIVSLSSVSAHSKDPYIHHLRGLQIVHAWRFFTKRHDFITGKFRRITKDAFEFYVNQHRVVAIRGETMRKIFYNEPNISMIQGHQFLIGAAPSLDDIKVTEEKDEDLNAGFMKRLLVVQHKDRVTSLIPDLLQHIDRHFKGLGKEGLFDPFKEANDIIFETTARLSACRELAENKDAMRKLINVFSALEEGTSPTSILFPWLPNSSRNLRTNATGSLYQILNSYVDGRRNDPEQTSDAIDVFIADGCSNPTIVTTIMNILFAGVINTGVNTGWALVHLGLKPEYKAKAISELKSLFEIHATNQSRGSLHDQLSSIPLAAWEMNTPVLEAIIRETLRLTMTSAPNRRVMDTEFRLGNVVVNKGEFVTYLQADAHLNPAIYPNPYSFDADRYGPGREEDKNEAYCYLGWGAGRHVCAGMKTAKLEIKMVLAMLLLGYDYQVVDEQGNAPKSVPRVNRNDHHQPRPVPEDKVYIKFKRIVD